MTTGPDRRRLLLAAAGAVLASAGPARSQAVATPPGTRPGASHGAVALRIVRDLVLPGTEALAGAAAGQAQAWEAFAASPGPAALARCEGAFQAAADAWAGIEAVRFGPVGDDLRHERIAHWPERKGAVGKAVAGLLAGTDALTPERLRRASVAGQGLSALERLLFGEGGGRGREGQGGPPRRCAGRGECPLEFLSRQTPRPAFRAGRRRPASAGSPPIRRCRRIGSSQQGGHTVERSFPCSALRWPLRKHPSRPRSGWMLGVPRAV